MTAHADLAALGVVQPHQQIRKRAFPRARMPYDAERLSVLHGKTHVINDTASFLIGKANAVKFDLSRTSVQFDRVGRFPHVRLRVHDFKKTAERIRTVRGAVDHFGEKVQRGIDHIHVSDESQQFAIGHTAVARHRHPAADAPRNQISYDQHQSRKRPRIIIELQKSLVTPSK